MISLFKGSITLSKGLAVTGSLGSISSFFGFKGDLERTFEVVSTAKNFYKSQDSTNSKRLKRDLSK